MPREGTKHRSGFRLLYLRDVFKDDGAVRKEMRAPVSAVRDKFQTLVGFRNWRNPSDWISSLLTDRMVSENTSTLALVPGRPLFEELGKNLLGARVLTALTAQ